MNEISQHPELMDTFSVKKPLPYFLGILSNQMQSTFQKGLTNNIKKLFEKVVTKWTFILLCDAAAL